MRKHSVGRVGKEPEAAGWIKDLAEVPDLPWEPSRGSEIHKPCDRDALCLGRRENKRPAEPSLASACRGYKLFSRTPEAWSGATVTQYHLSLTISLSLSA